MRSCLDVAIPGLLGLVLLVWPQSMFYGSRVTPDEGNIRRLRGVGAVLLLVAIGYLAVRLAGG